MTIAAILAGKSPEVVSIEAGEPIGAAIALLAERRIGAVPVIRDGTVAGILSERDIVACLAAEGAAVLGRRVDELMTAPAITVAPDVPALSALSQMSARRIRHLPVVEAGHLVGIVSIGDLVAHRISRIEGEADAMRAYIRGG